MDRCVKPLFSNESVFSLDSRQQPPGKQLPQLPSITPKKSEQLPFTVAYVQAYEFVCCKVFQQHMFDNGWGGRSGTQNLRVRRNAWDY